MCVPGVRRVYTLCVSGRGPPRTAHGLRVRLPTQVGRGRTLTDADRQVDPSQLTAERTSAAPRS